MTESLFAADQNINFTTKEGGPIIIAVAFLIVLGGAVAAGVFVCGWNRVKSMSVDWSRGSASIICR